MTTSLFLATRNRHKTSEIQTILGSSVIVTDATQVPGLPEVEETGKTFEANARLKAEAISDYVGGFVLADDSGLEVDALGGEPGIYSARYAGPNSTDLRNTELVLEKMKGVAFEQRTARFRCVLALAQGCVTVAVFDGSVEGLLTTEISGEGGFGYDPIFMPLGYDKTFGELPPELKNSMSHRARALAALQLFKFE
ncbi:MAG: RdgB/HAM1 family non-canonical purine NTP pyrophosphatase [Chthoniobacterales bacterium]